MYYNIIQRQKKEKELLKKNKYLNKNTIKTKVKRKI